MARNALWEQRFDVVSAPDTGADPDEGSFVYPIGAKEWTARAWRRHYGSTWPEVVAAKHRYDPRRILTPGPGMVFDADPSGPAAP